jgi:hypothetical protein
VVRERDVMPGRLRADFNGLFNGLLCLSHSDTATDELGNTVTLQGEMRVTAFDQDTREQGGRDDLVASGVVERAPGWLDCTGSRWVLRIDENGIRHESEVPAAKCER